MATKKKAGLSEDMLVAAPKKATFSEIQDKVDELARLCLLSGYPHIFVCADEVKGKTVYCKHVGTPLQCNKDLSTDLITPGLILFNQGFKIVPKEKAVPSVVKEADLMEMYGDDE